VPVEDESHTPEQLFNPEAGGSQINNFPYKKHTKTENL
jgi:hypothetical protein